MAPMRLLSLPLPSGQSPYDAPLAAAGFPPETPADLEALLDAVRGHRVDFLLLPDTGDALEQVRELAPQIPVVLVGDEDSALAAARAHARGALGYLAAPAEGPSEALQEVACDLVRRGRARLRVDEDRRAQLAEHLRLRRFYSEVLTSVDQGIVVIDNAGQIRFNNPASAKILGEDDATVESFDVHTAVPVLQQLVETLKEGVAQTETIALERPERKMFLDVSSSVIRDSDGQPSGAVAIVSDRSIERSLEQQLFHSERLATLGSLLASIAHEVNNTLTSITGCAEMGLMLADTAEGLVADLHEGKAAEVEQTLGGLSNEIREVFDLVLEAGLSAQTIADNMLQYSRQGKPSHRTPQDLNELIERTVNVLGKHIGTEKVTLQLALDPSKPRSRLEPSKLQQAVINLVMNAVQAMIEMEGVPIAERVLRLETSTEAGEAILRVADTGPGIPPKRLEQIFNPFFTTKDHGTGLGLHISKRVIEDQEGRLEVVSEVGKGTTFSIHLPLS